jgi:hypothetical protein
MTFARWMDFIRGVRAGLFTAAIVLMPALGVAGELQFQKPNRPGKTANGAQFRNPAAAAPAASAAPIASPTGASTSGNPLRDQSAARVVATTTTAAPVPAASQATFEHVAARPIAEAPRPAPRSTVQRASVPPFTTPDADLSGHVPSRRRAITAASIEPWVEQPTLGPAVQQAGYCDCGEPTCGICEPACGLADPGCGMMEPGCGMDPGCGMVDPGCGMEAACGIAEPDCGIDGCGAGVNAGSDFWCFPVCLPRIRDVQVWAGVHGFKGPRDSPTFDGAGDGNFGFQEGANIGGRAPLVGRLFPQLSYQLGYQAVQSQLFGNSDGATSDRTQDFITGGVFRRVNAGIQYGVVADWMRDSLQTHEDFTQLRYEISLKSAQGREFGFWGASHLNTKEVDGTSFQTVGQYCGFFRCRFGDGGALRFWGGATDDSEGLFGGDFIAPLNNRWSLQSGFNFLIPDLEPGSEAAREEAWNIGMNLVWHYGCRAKQTQTSRHSPVFSMADNGWMFIDQAN